jgi:hypothetical protein
MLTVLLQKYIIYIMDRLINEKPVQPTEHLAEELIQHIFDADYLLRKAGVEEFMQDQELIGTKEAENDPELLKTIERFYKEYLPYAVYKTGEYKNYELHLCKIDATGHVFLGYTVKLSTMDGSLYRGSDIALEQYTSLLTVVFNIADKQEKIGWQPNLKTDIGQES